MPIHLALPNHISSKVIENLKILTEDYCEFYNEMRSKKVPCKSKAAVHPHTKRELVEFFHNDSPGPKDSKENSREKYSIYLKSNFKPRYYY